MYLLRLFVYNINHFYTERFKTSSLSSFVVVCFLLRNNEKIHSVFSKTDYTEPTHFSATKFQFQCLYMRIVGCKIEFRSITFVRILLVRYSPLVNNDQYLHHNIWLFDFFFHQPTEFNWIYFVIKILGWWSKNSYT